MKQTINKILKPWFLIFLLVAVIHQTLEKVLDLHFVLIDSFLDPLLLMPILLHLLLWEKRILFSRGNQFVFSTLQLFLYFVLVSFITEYLFPKWNTGFTADIWDVACYGFGTLMFGFLFNKPYRVENKASTQL